MMKGLGKLFSTSDLKEEMKDFRNKMDYLCAQQTDVLRAVDHAEIQPGKKRKREVELWCESVEEKKIRFQEIDSEFNKQGPSSELKERLTKQIKEVEGLIHQGKFPSGVVLDNHSATRLEMVVNTLVGSRSEENIEMILKLLKQDDVFAIGVCGMGGVGKTALLKKIHNSLLRDSDIEGQVYWVTASRECNLQILQNAIGKRLGLDLSSEDDVERRRSLIFRRLSELRKSVLIIDDMWNHFLTDQVGIPLDSCGCKVVITTRSEEVCRKMGCQGVIKVSPLPEDDAWVLFVEKSGKVADDLYSTAKEIVRECGGLPLALNTMGCCMREVTDVQEWKTALHELQKPTRRQDDVGDHVFRVLQYSYDSLRDEWLKQCFLSCVLFPEDWVIRRAELIDLWMMEGLLDDIEGMENKENKGHTIVNNLERLSLLEPALDCFYEKGVRMHDLVRDMAMIVTQHHPHFMAKSGLLLKTVPASKLWSRDLVKVSLSHNNIKKIPLGMSPETSNLRVLILSDNPLREIPDSFFVHMKALEVLDLSYTSVKRLPDTVSDLINLRALLLEGCSRLISYVPSVAKMTKLMTLCLPEVECRAPEGMEALKCLQKVSRCRWRLSDLPRFNSFIQSCQLYSYWIWLYDTWDEAMFCDIPFDLMDWHDKRVIISGAQFGQTETTPVLPCDIQDLFIINGRIEGQRSLDEVLPSLRDAKSLRLLNMYDCVGLRYVSSAPLCVSSVSTYLDNLEELILIGLPNLKSIAENGSFSSLSHLKELTIEGCEEVEEIFESNQEFLSAHKNLNPGVALPKLWSLTLRDLPKLKNIYSLQLHLCTSLRSINISGCRELEGIVMSPTYNGDTAPIPWFPSLSYLNLSYLPLLRSIYPMQLHQATSLSSISLIGCPKLEGIFTSCTADNKSILTLPKLRSLDLRRLPNLSSVYRGLLISASLESWSLTVYECPKLKMLSLSYKLICDASQSTLASLPTESESPEWWKTLHQVLPYGVVIRLSDYILQARRKSPLGHDNDDHDDDKTNRASWLSLSTS